MWYTQQQALFLVDLDQSTFVYWMRAVSRIERLKGRGCHFTQADLTALSVLRVATRELGCSISSLADSVSQLFDILSAATPAELLSAAVVIDKLGLRIERLPIVVSDTSSVALIPLRPIIERIKVPNDELLPLERLMFR